MKGFEEITTLSFENPLEALKHIQKTGTLLKVVFSVSKIKSYKEKTLTYRTGFLEQQISKKIFKLFVFLYSLKI